MKRIFTAVLTFLFALAVSAHTEAANVTGVSWAARTDATIPFVRIVLDLSEPVRADFTVSKDGKAVYISLPDSAVSQNVDSSYTIGKQNAETFTVSSSGSDVKTCIRLKRALSKKEIKVFSLKPDAKAGRPNRLVIDIPSRSQNAATVSDSSESKTTATATSYAKKILKNKIICIDPGHGGADVGAIGMMNGKKYYEKDITMAIAKPLRELLKNAGAKVVMTHATDKDVYAPYADDVKELQARCDIATKADADAFISIHIDSFSNAAIDGTTVYYYPKASNDLVLAQRIHYAIISNLAIPDRGVRSNDLYVNVHTKMPSVLVEMGFISNTHRLKMLTSSWGAKSIANSLYEGLIDYFAQIA